MLNSIILNKVAVIFIISNILKIFKNASTHPTPSIVNAAWVNFESVSILCSPLYWKNVN